MRPIDRGGAPRAYTHYRDAIGDLEDRLGRFCSYCETPLKVGLAVEHMAPKTHCQDLALAWDNLLLACQICNSVKGKKVVNDSDVLWPDRHNTMLALAYSKGGFVGVAEGLGSDLNRRARVLINLVGLDRHNAEGWTSPTRRDQRWRDREEAWAAAELCLLVFENLNPRNPEMAVNLVVTSAKGFGFFSVWFFVFSNFQIVKGALIQEFPGTAASCFNEEGKPVKRPGSEI